MKIMNINEKYKLIFGRKKPQRDYIKPCSLALQIKFEYP